MKKILLIITAIVISLSIYAGEKDSPIKWYSFEEAIKLQKENPKMIFIDVYTDWCGWCKKMDKSTFANEEIAKYMNENYYAVKFDAEMKADVDFKGKTYVNNGKSRRSSHELAKSLLNGQMSYPSYAFLDKDAELLTVVQGYMEAPDFEPILHYFGEDHYKETEWKDFKSSFKGSL